MTRQEGRKENVLTTDLVVHKTTEQFSNYSWLPIMPLDVLGKHGRRRQHATFVPDCKCSLSQFRCKARVYSNKAIVPCNIESNFSLWKNTSQRLFSFSWQDFKCCVPSFSLSFGYYISKLMKKIKQDNHCKKSQLYNEIRGFLSTLSSKLPLDVFIGISP